LDQSSGFGQPLGDDASEQWYTGQLCRLQSSFDSAEKRPKEIDTVRTIDKEIMTDYQGPQQRLRIEFALGERLKYISHLDLTRAWERAFRRAGLPLAYSQGFNPRPRFQIAAALPVGISGQSELLDVWLDEVLEPAAVLRRLRPALPEGLRVSAVSEVDLRQASLQSQMRAADYRATVAGQEPAEAIRARIEALLAAPAVLRQRHHKGRLQTYDLRPLIQEIEVTDGGDGPTGGMAEHVLEMRLQASPQGAGRPDEVLDALGLSLMPHRIERTKLHFEFDK
jgi:radical SAM-linked protein